MEPEQRASLARKYATLAALRRAYDATREVATREVLRALATEFPGALRELDMLSLAEIDRRAEVLTDGPEEPWMPWMLAYHGLMRSLLALKLAAARGAEVTPEIASRTASEITFRTGVSVSAEAVAGAIAPMRGRLNARAFAMLGEHFGEHPSVIWQALFPSAKREAGAEGGGPL